MFRIFDLKSKKINTSNGHISRNIGATKPGLCSNDCKFPLLFKNVIIQQNIRAVQKLWAFELNTVFMGHIWPIVLKGLYNELKILKILFFPSIFGNNSIIVEIIVILNHFSIFRHLDNPLRTRRFSIFWFKN